MKKFSGFLFLIGLIAVLWLAAYISYTSGDIAGTYITFGLGASFTILLMYSIHHCLNLKRKDEFVSQNFEIIMTHFHHIEEIKQNLYYLHTIWLDAEGNQYLFKSDELQYNPTIALRGQLIPVKISQLNRSYYTMDLSSLPKLA